MLDRHDYVVVGAGPTGCTFARCAAEAGKTVLILEARNHVGGNCYDEIDEETGVLKHVYGPHIFRTNSERVITYLKRFTEFTSQQYRLLSDTRQGKFQWPINLTTLEQFFQCSTLTAEEAEALLKRQYGAGSYPEPKNSKELIVNRFGYGIYEAFFRGYTTKQWGMDPSELAPEVCARVVNPVLDRYAECVRGKYLCMPTEGYTKMFERMIDHENIHVELGVPPFAASLIKGKLVWTGALDAYFMYQHGRLPWRGLRIEWSREDLPVLGVVYPNERDPLTRAIDIRHITGQKHLKPCTSYEYPSTEGQHYPVPTPAARAMAAKYLELAEEAEKEDVYIAGRLGRYKYINTDEAVLQALELADRILK